MTRRMARPSAILAFLIQTLIFAGTAPFAPSVRAQSAPAAPAAPATASVQAPVVLNGQTLFSVTGDDPEARATRIEKRLMTLVTRRSDVGSFEVQHQGDNYLLSVGDIPVLTVTSTDAQDNLMTAPELARQWGQTLTDAVQSAREENRSWTKRIINPVVRSLNRLLDGLLETAPRLIGALILLILTYIGAHLVKAAATPLVRRAPMDANLQQLARSLAYYGAWVAGLMAMASIMGFQGASIVAALGVGGFVLGFAFKDILSHFLAGVLILAGRSFQIGDQIAVKGNEGTVERIDLRATLLRTYDNRLVIIPNGDVFTSVVTNNTESALRRQEFDILLDYSADIAQAQLLAFRTMKGTEGVIGDPAPDVLVAELSSGGVTLRCRFYTDPRRKNVLAVGSEARRRVKDAFLREGISLPKSGTQISFDPKLEKPVIQAVASYLAKNQPQESDERRLYQRAIRESLNGEEREPGGDGSSEERAKEKAQVALPRGKTMESE